MERNGWGVSPEAEALLREALVWDGHAGFAYEPDVDLSELERWRASGVDYVSVNIVFDAPPWNAFAIEALSSYRRQIRAHPDRFVLVSTVEDIRRAKREGKLAVGFDIEGMVALNGDIGMVEVFHRLGVRQMLFAYNLNNAAGGGCHDKDVGLTEFGRAVVKEMNRVGMIVDCSHCAFTTSLEAIALSEAPVVFSHSNARALHDHQRNILDEQAKACAAKGGVVGVTGVGLFLGPRGADLDDLVRHIGHYVELIGPKHVSVGMDSVLLRHASGFEPPDRTFWPPSQYPGGKIEFVPPESFPRLTEKLLARGHAKADVAAILGGNFLRVAGQIWR
ncbi:MAG: dipeptidase [Parvibaculaceae bacterium]